MFKVFKQELAWTKSEGGIRSPGADSPMFSSTLKVKTGDTIQNSKYYYYAQYATSIEMTDLE
jgi:hypothetical protein